SLREYCGCGGTRSMPRAAPRLLSEKSCNLLRQRGVSAMRLRNMPLQRREALQAHASMPSCTPLLLALQVALQENGHEPSRQRQARHRGREASDTEERRHSFETGGRLRACAQAGGGKR